MELKESMDPMSVGVDRGSVWGDLRGKALGIALWGQVCLGPDLSPWDGKTMMYK